MKKNLWTKKKVQDAIVPNFGKKYIVAPSLLRLLGNVKNKKILEFGSGNGYWLALFAKKGAQCTGIEISNAQLEEARKRDKQKKIQYIQGDITKLENNYPPYASYDIVFLEHVVLEIPSRKKLEKIFRAAFTLLKNGGTLIISDLHPFAPSARPKNITTTKGYAYFSSGNSMQIVSKKIDGKKIMYQDFHWTLEDLIQSITKSGMRITDILEPKPSPQQAKKYPQLTYRLKIPMSIIIKATK